MAAQLAAIDTIAAEPAPATFENTIAALEGSDRLLEQVAAVYGIWGSTMSTPDVPGGRDGDGPEARRLPRPDHAEREAVRAHRGGLRGARQGRRSPPSRSGSPGCTTRTSCGPAPGSTPRPRSASPRSTSGWPACYTTFGQNVLADENDYVARPGERDGPRRPPRLLPLRRGGGRGGARARRGSGPSPTRARASSRSSRTPTAATCARRSGARSSTAATTATPTTTRRSSPRSSRCAPSGRSCSATRPTPTGASRTRWRGRPSGRWP